MKAYTVRILPAVYRKVRRFPADIVASLYTAIESLAGNPCPRGCRKVRGQRDAWRLVVRKDYRVLYTVDDEARVVVVCDADRREKDTYRR